MCIGDYSVELMLFLCFDSLFLFRIFCIIGILQAVSNFTNMLKIELYYL